MTIIICYSIAIEGNGTIGFYFITTGDVYMVHKNQSRVRIDRASITSFLQFRLQDSAFSNSIRST